MGANRIQQAIADKQEAARHHEAMYLAVGRTLRVAQEFEQNARFVTWAAGAHANVQKATEDGVSELWQVLTSTNYPSLIGPALKVLEGLNVFDAEYMTVLGHAKDGRNSIAHEAALFADDSTSLMGELAAKWIMWVDAVQTADIRLSKAALRHPGAEGSSSALELRADCRPTTTNDRRRPDADLGFDRALTQRHRTVGGRSSWPHRVRAPVLCGRSGCC